MRPGKSLGIDASLCTITVAEKGYADFEISRRGPCGHSSKPGKQGAFYYIAKAILAIEENPFPYRITEAVKTRFEILAPYMEAKNPKLSPLMSDVEGNWDALLPYIDAGKELASLFHTTTAITMSSGSQQANILPEKASIIVNCRLLAGDTLESVQSYLESILPEGLDVTLLKGNNPSGVSVYECPFKNLLVDISRNRFGDLVALPDVLAGGTDAKNMYNLSNYVFRFGSFYKRDGPCGAHFC